MRIPDFEISYMSVLHCGTIAVFANVIEDILVFGAVTIVAAIAATVLMSLEKVHATRENEITLWLDKQEQKNILCTEQCVYFSGTVVISSSGCFQLVFRIPFKCQNMYLYLHFVSVSRFCIGLTLLWPFFSHSLCPALVVPGYRQVSGRRKDLFCCFGSLVSVGSQGKGWGGSTTHLCLRLI